MNKQDCRSAAEDMPANGAVSLSEWHAAERTQLTACDYAKGVRDALRRGAHSLAREIAEAGSTRYGEDPELKAFAAILAPPTFRVGDKTHRVGGNLSWMKEHASRFRGEWVALRNGALVAHAPSLSEMKAALGDISGLFLARA